jgi:hypothetical protein
MQSFQFVQAEIENTNRIFIEYDDKLNNKDSKTGRISTEVKRISKRIEPHHHLSW